MTLDEVLADALRLLAAGAADRIAPFRTLALATVDAADAPDQRIVVLRSFDGAARRLTLHTDARSAKSAQILARPAVALLGWDPGQRLQVRLRGRATPHSGDAVARDAWAALPQVARQLYRLRQAPGTRLPDPSPAQYDEAPEALGFAAFVVVDVVFDILETLLLRDDGQQRARFAFVDDGMDAAWLVP